MPGSRDSTPNSGEQTVLTSPSMLTGVEPVADPSPTRLHALVISDKVVATYPLPDRGVIKIGRSPNCEIQIDDVSISRMHASLSIGPPLMISDLGSANGTTVHDKKLEKDEAFEIAPGEAVQIGKATLIVQRQAAPIRQRRLWTHDYFEVRLEEECARGTRGGVEFGIMRVHCTSPAGPDVIRQAVGDLVRLADVVGEYGPADYEILLVDSTPEDVEDAERRIVTELSRKGLMVRVGTACYPRDGRNSDQLMSRAENAARGMTATEVQQRRGEVVAERTMQDLYTLAGRVAHGTISVLILGETGVGKEVLAEKVHKLSPRAAKPYLRLNCAALSESLLESELFGYERGAFTGAVGTKAGLLETADGGSVFLDEVGELPLSMQVKLLRVIEERVVLRVGGLKPRPLDVRFIAATNRDLEAEIGRGTFRQDLYFRLNGATLVIPPLRERLGEISGLARAFLANAAKQAGLTQAPELTEDALQALLGYSWPGNIRELRNMIERALLLAGEAPIELRHLPTEKMRLTFAASSRAVSEVSRPMPHHPSQRADEETGVHNILDGSNPVLRRGPKLSLDEERAQIEAALQACGGNQTRAAKMLGIARRTLINRVKEFGLTRPRAR